MRKALSMVIVGMLVLGLTACSSSGGTSGSAPAGGSTGTGSSAEAEKNGTKYWTFATPPTTSALYTYCVGVGQAIQDKMPEYQITMSECTGAVQITKLVRQNNATIGNSVSSTDFENYTGVGDFNGSAGKDSRILWYYENTPLQLVVSKSSGITDVAQLNGKKFNPGGATTSAESLTHGIMTALGVKPNYYVAGQSDAGDAYSNRQIDGVVKAGPAGDSFVVQLNAAVPVRILSFTDEELDKIVKAIPYVVKTTIPAGSYSGQDYDVKTVETMMGVQTSVKNMTQEDGYKLISCYLGNAKASVDAAYPSGKKVDVVKLTLNSPVPLQAGTVQYLVEKGYKVPKNLIPPEYTPVSGGSNSK